MNEENIPSPVRVEEVVHGLQVKWFRGDEIVCYKLLSMSHSLLESWSATVLKILEAWPADKPYLAIHDLDEKGVGLAYSIQTGFDVLNIGVRPASRQPAEDLIEKQPNRRARVAFIFNDSVSGNLGHVFARNQRVRHTLIEYQVFFDFEAAYKWVSSQPEQK